MFQTYTISANRDAGPERLRLLHEQMKANGVSCFLVPHADEHQNEYLPPRAERLSWLTGFTGSAGFAIATLKNCVVFVDGRYTLQVKEQIHPDAFTAEDLISLPPSKWLEKNTSASDVIGYDPWLITKQQMDAYTKVIEKTGATLKPVPNLVDLIWEDQPPAPQGEVSLHPVELAGNSISEKIAEIQEIISEKEADLTVLTDPASLAWLFNIRGSDMVHNPLALGFAILPANRKPVLFIDPQKLSKDIRASLETYIEVASSETFRDALSEAAAEKSVLCDTSLLPVILYGTIEKAGGKIVSGRDPVILPRAIKNQTEIQGARNAHLRDGVAMCKFLCWLDDQPFNAVDEISAAKKLEECRLENAAAMGSELREVSFDTISGHGPNGAIVHYRVSEETNRTFTDNSLYLCDSGGQYPDGTTDITRTIAIGTPSEQAITDFTLVLKGHIALATVRFPEGTRGVDLDVLARNALWQHGKDFAHGTGHGVGSYLNVHEGPQSISKRGMEPLVPGMITSNEPGFYVEGQYGIRIENLVLTTEAEDLDGGNIKMHAFETLTLCPIDNRLLNSAMLVPDECEWLNSYHTRVQETLSPYLNAHEKAWLENATKAI